MIPVENRLREMAAAKQINDVEDLGIVNNVWLKTVSGVSREVTPATKMTEQYIRSLCTHHLEISNRIRYLSKDM